MKLRIQKALDGNWDALIIPFSSDLAVTETLPPEISEAVSAALKAEKLSADCGSVYAMELYGKEGFKKVVLVSVGNGGSTNREVFLAFAAAFKSCKDSKAAVTAVLLDNAAEITGAVETAKKVCELPYLVSYQFNAYKSVPVENGMKETVIVTAREDMQALAAEAGHVAESTMLARDLVNHPPMYMSPEQFASECEKMAEELGIEAQIYNKVQAEEMGMGAFLSVARGSVAEPRVIVLRYHGGAEGEAPVALVGKGVMFDSGGYSLKSNMTGMHGDMGGAAAVVGAIRAIALQKLPVNVVAVVAACKNMVSGDAYVPGDILTAMNGKKIEMLNSDAEGRLTLADALTYAIQKEGAETIIDIATLTGASGTAVGLRSAAVLANDEELFEEIKAGSEASAEKICRLPLDKELMPAVTSKVADIKNSCPGSPLGGGVITAALFLEEFVEDKPWVHVDMAPVNWLTDEISYSIQGGTGYGVSLLYETVKIMTE